MAARMLIDAAHPEEIRVAVVRGSRLEEFDFESAARKPLRGNVYLAKVTRVEPSLQSAFIDFGGNRHGFLPFNEIHPDYYQIPIEDRQALLDREAEQAAEDDAEEGVGSKIADPPAPEEPELDEAEAAETSAEGQAEGSEAKPESENGAALEGVETVGGDDEVDEAARARGKRRSRPYKIQEVIKRRQILLVQAVKEERGNKGAALTTYLSLAGRYCVLMPNTPQGGGISRKIVDTTDRSRLKAVMSSLDIPEGMGLIVRTAGMERNKAEIRRDYEYLVRLWDSIRTRTLHSTAPALIHEEANLIKRSIRDLHAKDVSEILVEGPDGYRTAKAFMRALMPSHAKRVQPYEGDVPLFQDFKVERELDSIHDSSVQLRSGGYVVINATEALVAIDVNSGRATKERNIEETALKTNLEAAEEVARQLRIRDLAGLIVIDFIDMTPMRNNRAVERRFKDSLKSDRARIQVGRISAFGLMEMSRQRLRTSVLEASTTVCPNCTGTGVVRSTESAGLQVLRALEEEASRNPDHDVTVYLATRLAIYLLNEKRETLGSIEARHNVKIVLASDDSLVAPEYRLERGALRVARSEPVDDVGALASVEAEAEAQAEAQAEAEPPGENDEEEQGAQAQKKRRRRGRRGGRRRTRSAREDDVTAVPTLAEPDSASAVEAGAGAEPEMEGQPPEPVDEAAAPKPRRRRARRPRGGAAALGEGKTPDSGPPDSGPSDSGPPDEAAAPKPRRRRARRPKNADQAGAIIPIAAAEPAVTESAAGAEPLTGADAEPAPPPTEHDSAASADAAPAEDSFGPGQVGEERAPEDPAPPERRGWWRRATGQG